MKIVFLLEAFGLDETLNAITRSAARSYPCSKTQSQIFRFPLSLTLKIMWRHIVTLRLSMKICDQLLRKFCGNNCSPTPNFKNIILSIRLVSPKLARDIL